MILSPCAMVCLVLIHGVYFQAVNVRHNKVGENNEPAIYRINDDLVMPLHSVYV